MRILISGATQGLGQSLVIEALRRYPQAKIVGFSRGEENLRTLREQIQASYPQDAERALLIQGDIGSAESRRKIIEAAVEFFDGEIDVLISNVGIFRFDREVSEIPNEDWELDNDAFAVKYSTDPDYAKKEKFHQMVRTNLVGNRDLLDRVVERTKQKGVTLDVVDVGSVGVVADLIGKPMEGTTHYGHSKRRLVDHTLELAQHHDFIRVAIVHPGPFGKSAQVIADEFGDTWAVDVESIAKHTFDLLDEVREGQSGKVSQGIIASSEHFSLKSDYFAGIDSAGLAGLNSKKINSVPAHKSIRLERRNKE